MQEALFQTESPIAAHGRVEFYYLSLLHEQQEGQVTIRVHENHGWWDNDSMSAVYEEQTSYESTAFPHYHDAVEQYWRRRLFHIRREYVHSFMWHPITGVPAFYKRLDPA